MEQISATNCYGQRFLAMEACVESEVQTPLQSLGCVACTSCFVKAAELVPQLQAENEQLRVENRTDLLTNIPNMRGLSEAFDTMEAAGKHIGAMFIDARSFKNINESYGHSTGDVALQFIAQFLASDIRGEDTVVSRKGGDEFVLLLDLSPRIGANEENLSADERMSVVSERVSTDFSSIPQVREFNTLVPALKQLGLKIGTAELQPGMNLPDLIEAADPKGKLNSRGSTPLRGDELEQALQMKYAKCGSREESLKIALDQRVENAEDHQRYVRSLFETALEAYQA